MPISFKEFKNNLEERCWPGYKPAPGKKAYDKGSCIKEEETISEMDKSAPQPGRDGKVSHSTYGSRDKEASDYFKGKENPAKLITAKQMSKDALDILRKQGVAEDWQKVNRQDKTDGLSPAAVKAYRRENPGSKLQTAVTEKNPKGKRAARRKSFCSRMSGMKKRLTSAKNARDPDSPINKALRRWNC